MGNLRAAALACGVIASCLAGGFGISFVSSQMSSAKSIEEENSGSLNADDAIITTVNATSTQTTENAKKTVSVYKYTAKPADVTEGTNELTTTTIAAYTAKTIETTTVAVTTEAVVTEPETQAPTEAPAETTEAVAEEKIETPEVNPVVIEPVTDAPVQEQVEPNKQQTFMAPAPLVPVSNASVSNISADALPITDEEYVLLCNCVANEAGSAWISENDKARIVEVIMNRVSSPLYPNSIYDVISQRNQFSGSSRYVNLTTYTGAVSESVKSAVLLYFADPSQFNEGFMGFYGNGRQNIFY